MLVISSDVAYFVNTMNMSVTPGKVVQSIRASIIGLVPLKF